MRRASQVVGAVLALLFASIVALAGATALGFTPSAVVNSATVLVDLACGGCVDASDIATGAANSNLTTNTVALNKLVNAGAQNHFPCRKSASAGAWEDCTQAEAQTAMGSASTAITQAAYGSCSPTSNGDVCFATDGPLRVYRSGGANTTWLQGAPTLPGALTPPTTSTFGTTFGSATLSGNPLIVSGAQTNTATLRGAYTTTSFPSPPYHINVVFEGPRVLPAGFGGACGLLLTDGTKFLACYIGASSGTPYLQWDNWTDNVTYSSSPETLGSSRFMTGNVYALQWTDDGTNVSCRFLDPDGSSVGKRFTSTTIARTNFLTPTGWGVMLEEAGSSVTFNYPSPVCRFLHASIGAGTTGWP